MRIATITNWAYGVSVALTVISGTVTLMASQAEERERAAVEQRNLFDELTQSLEEDTYRLTEQARLFSINGNKSHLAVYGEEARNLGSVEQRVARLRDAGAKPLELDALRDGLRWADSLHDEQQAAINAKQAGDGEGARSVMFGAEYERDLDRVANSIGRFQFLLNQRTEAAVDAAAKSTRTLRTASEAMLGITALMFLFVLFFLVKQRILRPVVRLSDVVTRLASEDFAAEPPDYNRIDEIGDMAQAVRIFRENGLARQRLEREKALDQEMRDLLARMTQRLQGCNGVGDLGEIVRLFAPQIVPSLAGRLYVHDGVDQAMVELSNWQEPAHSLSTFPPNQCWALRRGQPHRPAGRVVDVPCAHIESGILGTLCVPLSAQGETIGLLYFEEKAPSSEADAAANLYIELLAENVGLALANLRLRDELRRLALIDPLTGLSNRHQLDSALTLQAAQAERNHEPLTCVMLDVDHFKRFNDMFGHDAGDAVLRGVGKVLANATRNEGMAFRYGGEEFLLLMPGFDLEHAKERCEAIRRDIRGLQISHEGKVVGQITSSFGIAAHNDQGPPSMLVQTADAALLRAKQEGRDRIVAAV